MSKATKSASKSRSHSRSRSRSRSVSRSRSSSRSRSRKHRYSSRSRTRSRSRSHSPPHSNQERNYPREYQNNNREFRGYHRGFRRPYYFRGRGRGYFPRGRFQRGGGGGYNNNYHPNNWQKYRQYPQQQQQQQQQQQRPHSPRRGRSHSPKKRSGSPRSHSHSKYSDRSSSPRSRRSHHSSSSHSSSPTRRSASGSATQNSKDVKKERSASKEVQKRGGEVGGVDGEPVEITGGSAGPDGGTSGDKRKANWQGVTDYSNSPKRSSPQVRSAVIIGQGAPATTQSSPSPKTTNANSPNSDGAPSWQTQMVGSLHSTKSPPQKRPTPVLSGFGFFSKEDNLVGDKTDISSVFKRFNHKKKQSGWENGREMETNSGDVEREKGNGLKCSGGVFDREPDKGEMEKYREAFDDEGNLSLNSFLKASPFFSCDGEEEEQEEMIPKPRSKVLRKERDREDKESPKPKSKVKLSARELFEERFGKWEDLAYLQVAAKDDDLDAMAEEIYRSRKQEKAAAIAAALANREAIAGMLRGFSPENVSKGRRKEKAASSPSPTPAPRRNSDQEMFMVRGEDSPPRASGKRGAEFSVRMDSLRDDVASSSGVTVGERRLSRDLVHPTKKEQEFRSIFQHIQATQLRSPSELFAQHIVTIVHYIKAQHFPSDGITLNERFALYQRRAAEKEMMKPRKSPEIHRIIDVSPSAFKKHSHLFEGMKSSGDGSYKDQGKKMKGDSMDLRLDIERRKKYSTRERDYKQDGGRDSGDSPEASRERSAEKSSKHHKKSKKNKKKRSRSRSSSSAESHRGGDYPNDEPEPKDEGFNKARLRPQGDYGGAMERGRGRGGFQFRIRGRGWNRGNYHGNNTNGNPPNMVLPVHLKNEDWDPEYTPKSRKYYLHDDREGERKWVDNRGRGGRGNFLHCSRGRFIIRKATVGPPNNNSSPKWTHDKFQVNGRGEEGELKEEDTEQDHKDQENSEDMENAEQ